MAKKLAYQVLEPFLTQPYEKLHVAGIAQQLREPRQTVSLWLSQLEKTGVLTKQFQGKLTQYSLNRKHPLIIDYLVIAEKQKLVRKCEKELVLRELVSFIHMMSKENTKVCFFGSATQSLERAHDIDLLVVGTIDTEALKNISQRLNKEIHLIRVAQLTKITETLKKEIIKKHLIVQGSEQIIRWLLW